MAKEQQRFQQSSAESLCANNCGLYGTPATLNLCSECYRRRESDKVLAYLQREVFIPWLKELEEAREKKKKAALEKTNRNTTSCGGPTRCSACKKRVGFIGFKCRCGALCCGAHRYPELHSCSFDYKAFGKAAIAKANPVIKAAKLDNKL